MNGRRPRNRCRTLKIDDFGSIDWFNASKNLAFLEKSVDVGYADQSPRIKALGCAHDFSAFRGYGEQQTPTSSGRIGHPAVSRFPFGLNRAGLKAIDTMSQVHNFLAFRQPVQEIL